VIAETLIVKDEAIEHSAFFNNLLLLVLHLDIWIVF
jgi:hypothetical protein